ncbi:MAG: site-specific integrase [Clostridia bacterium]|nr:site-specific integrase [Clostridia bacterium]
MIQNETNYGKILFSKCCNEWLELKKTLVKESSYFNYQFAVEKHIKPVLGKMKIRDIEKYDMNDFIKIKKEQGLTTSLKELLVRVKSIFKFIKKKYGINFDFDFNTGYVARVEKLEVLTEKERLKLSRFLSETDDIRYLGILICLYSGLRIGEICGLKWKDIDLETKEISVERTVQRVYTGKKKKSKVVVTLPKTAKSIRKIPISRSLLETLKKEKKKYDENCFITTGETERSFEPFTYRYVYKQALKNCDIPYKKFHCLRHTFATRCIRVGMDIKSLSEVLGHSNIGTTMNIYVHSSYEVKKKYIDKL